ncbi:MAG: 1-deoxy-D-xylulose-5-phosphate reductoisomerase [Bacteroidales bacterium]|nr:1-deoxy-D-xylulose-5-phosphate reductoisomerase [Bacteroidales bacterium]
MKKRVSILGSTGSIGRQALEVIEAYPDFFEVELLVANTNHELLISQAKKFNPNTVVIADESKYFVVSEALKDTYIKVFAGKDSVAQSASMQTADIVLTAMVGFAGLEPTIEAVKAGKRIALANKETLVVAGEIIRDLASEFNSSIIPVDSEHSAIFQCLVGEINPIEKIILTASGGPFREKSVDELHSVTPAQALQHPNWTMGDKITIDSATLMNKGFEAIEAKWLFDLQPNQIEVVVHPQSIIHSMVQFQDGSIKAQMGLPDMKLPIQYALSFPHRLPSGLERFSFLNYSHFSFFQPDLQKFPCLSLCFDAMKKAGNMPCIVNAANEIAVEGFLKEKIKFTDIPIVIEKSLEKVAFMQKPGLDDLYLTDRETRIIANELIKLKK